MLCMSDGVEDCGRISTKEGKCVCGGQGCPFTTGSGKTFLMISDISDSLEGCEGAGPVSAGRVVQEGGAANGKARGQQEPQVWGTARGGG